MTIDGLTPVGELVAVKLVEIQLIDSDCTAC